MPGNFFFLNFLDTEHQPALLNSEDKLILKALIIYLRKRHAEMAFSYLAINTPPESVWEQNRMLNQKLVSFKTAEIAAALYLLEQGVPYSVFIIINQSRLRHRAFLAYL